MQCGVFFTFSSALREDVGEGDARDNSREESRPPKSSSARPKKVQRRALFSLTFLGELPSSSTAFRAQGSG